MQPLLQLPPALPGASGSSCASDSRSGARPRSGIARRTTMPSAARQYAPFLDSRTSSKSPIPYGLAKSLSARLISGAPLSLCFACTGKSKSPVPHFVGDRAFAREGCRSGYESPPAVETRHRMFSWPQPGMPASRASARDDGTAWPPRSGASVRTRAVRRGERAVANEMFCVMRSSFRRASRARSRTRAITTLPVAGCRNGRGIGPSDSSADSPGGMSSGRGAATSSRPRRFAPARNSGNRPFQGARANRSCGRRSPRLRSNRCASCASWSWLRFP